MSNKAKKRDRTAVVASQPKPYLKRPLAPAPKPVFVGVCILAVILFAGASKVHNDWVAVFGCCAVLALVAVILDFFGRREAQRHPNALYRSDKLPEGDKRAKVALVVCTLISLVGFVGRTARPGHDASPFPYFLAAGFLFFVMPQALAWNAMAKAKQKGKRSTRK